MVGMPCDEIKRFFRQLLGGFRVGSVWHGAALKKEESTFVKAPRNETALICGRAERLAAKAPSWAQEEASREQASFLGHLRRVLGGLLCSL